MGKIRRPGISSIKSRYLRRIKGLSVETMGLQMTAKKRGRPPTGKAATGAERVRKYRQTRKAMIEAGGRRLDLVLDQETTLALGVCMAAHSGITAGELVGQLLQREARYLQGVESELKAE